MRILITNWTNWLGFHFINELLEEGYTVHALITDSEQRTNHFAEFFIRNSSFCFVENGNLSTYDEAIVIGNFPIKNILGRRIWHINCTLSKYNGKCIFVFTPILFGEWMPLNEEGIFFQGKLIPFTSEYFRNETIYIKDFMKIFKQWLKSVLVPHRILLCTNQKKCGRETFMLENIIYLRDNRPKCKPIETIKRHYKRYKRMYEID